MNIATVVHKQLIIIIGARKFTNELFANYISKELKMACSIETTLMEQSCTLKAHGQGVLVLLDCHALSPPEIWAKLLHSSVFGKMEEEVAVALVNLEYDLKFGIDALAKGVKGLFYVDDSLETLKKGVLAIFNGELWFSRETLMKSLLLAQKYSRQGTLDTAAAILTRREKEILAMIASGSTNTDLSKSLNISPHTVKTHINNIFGKINAPNRVQAVLWATKHLL